MAIVVFVVVLIIFDIAAWFWGVDSRGFGRDPRSDGRPERWI